MADPSQPLPPWLTPSPVVVTDAAGVVATDTAIVYVPPTYFGPSIPLGTLYSFGGSTFPPSIQLPGSPTATPSDTTSTTSSSSALPTSITSAVTTTSTSSSSTTSTATPTSLTTTTSTTSSSPPTTTLPTSTLPTTTSPTTTPTSTPTGTLTSLSKGQLVGVIVASILGLIFLFVLALFLFLWCKGRRNRRPIALRTIDEDYYIVTPGHTPGDGSPRHSGEEADPFLVPHADTAASAPAPAAPVMTQVDEHGTRPYPFPAARVPAPLAGSTSTTSSNSNASGYGVLLDRPSLGLMPEVSEEDRHQSGTRLTPEQMRRLEQENVLPDDDEYDGEYTGAYAYSTDPLVPPPRLVDPEKKFGPDILPEPFPLAKKPSDDGDEDATLLTARRVRVDTLGPRAAPQLQESPGAGPSRKVSSGLLNALGLGLGGLVNLGRKSWFKNLESPRNSGSSYEQVFDAEKDLEPGLLSPSQPRVDSMGNRVGRVGMGPDGSRPKSGVSARSAASGQTLYHDATSSLPGTPLLAPLPPARTTPDSTPPRMPQPVLPTGDSHGWLSNPMTGPPTYDDSLIDLNASSPSPRLRTRSPGAAGYNALPSSSDILDMPAPTALNHFSSLSSLRDTATSSPTGGSSVTPLFPPGLDTTIRPVGWAASTTAATGTPESGVPMGLGMDVLDQVPPDAEQGWKTMANVHHAPAGYRGSFGNYFHSPGFASEQGSLHSMRSVFDPPSMRSSGSAPAAQLHNNPYYHGYAPSPYGSASSRPSHRSVAMSMANSIARTGSIPSMNKPHPSPAMSAFGPQIPRGSPALAHGSGPHTPSSGSYPAHSRQNSDPFAFTAPTILDSPYQPAHHLPPPPRAALSSPDKSLSVSLASATTLVDRDGDLSMLMNEGGQGTVRCRTNNPFLQPQHHPRSPSPSNASLALSGMSGTPWAGGLDSDWSPAL